jgi:chemotaxis protein MotB
MSRRRGGGGGDEGGNWMDTYGDLVTLLLTFFVLLYSMSSLDQNKWRVFVQSIYPGTTSAETENVTVNQVDPSELSESNESGAVIGESVAPNDVTGEDTSELYLQIASKLDEAGISGVTSGAGDGYTFVIFKDKMFFEGDSSVLTQTGKDTLDIFCSTIAPYADKLSQVNIMGHTAQGNPDRVNTVRTDRMLSANRAAEVCIYIQNKNIIDPSKLISIGYGQWRPIESNDTYEGRAANRRVEILMIDRNAEIRSLDEYYEEITSGGDEVTSVVTDGSSAARSGAAAAPSDAAAEMGNTAVSGAGMSAETGTGKDAEADTNTKAEPEPGEEAVSTLVGGNAGTENSGAEGADQQ